MKKKIKAIVFTQEFKRLNNVKALDHRRSKAIGLLKRIRMQWVREKDKSSDADDLFLLAVLVRAYLDYLKLKKETKNIHFWENQEIVEAVWTKLCDLDDRLNYLTGRIEGNTLSEMMKEAAEIKKLFLMNYGAGMYSSPEMICKKVECSICNKNIKSCNHIPGRLYNGLRCVETPRDCELRSISIVKIPQDKRCRIWPWQLKETEDGETTFESIVLTVFRIDDFFHDNEWEKNV